MINKELSGCLFAAALTVSGAAWAVPVTYQFSVTGADLMSYSFVDGVDGSTAAENGLFDGARLVRLPSAAGGHARTYVESQHAAFANWATTTDLKLTSLNFWGFDGRGVNWGEDFKHLDSAQVTAPAGWTEWATGWLASWGPNPNPHTDLTPAWYANDLSAALGFSDANLADQLFSFQLTLDDADWLYGADTKGAPNTFGGPMTFWFGGWMGDESNPYQYIYEGNLVLTGTRVVPEPATMALFGLGLAGFAAARRTRRARA